MGFIMLKKMALYIIVFSLFGVSSAVAQNYGITFRAGTTGPGIDLTRSFGSHFSLRLGGRYLPYNLTGSTSANNVDISYQAKLKLESLSALIDWQPFRNWFRLSAGVYYNGLQANGHAKPTSSYTTDNHTFSPQKVGSLSGTFDYSHKWAPYIGLGIGNAANNGHHIGFLVDAGVMYTNAAHISMSGKGLIEPTANQDVIIQNGISGIKIYPVLSFGLSYRFIGH